MTACLNDRNELVPAREGLCGLGLAPGEFSAPARLKVRAAGLGDRHEARLAPRLRMCGQDVPKGLSFLCPLQKSHRGAAPTA